MARFTGVLGLLTMLALGYLFSTNRRAIKLKTVAWGLGLQIKFAFLVFYWTFGQQHFFGADRSAADHPPVPSRSDAVRTDDDHDQRHGARFGRNYGGVYRVRSRGATPAHGGHHDGAGHFAYLKNAGS